MTRREGYLLICSYSYVRTFVGKVLILLHMTKSTLKTDVGGTSNRESMKTPKTPKPKPAPKPITFGELADREHGLSAVDACAHGAHGFVYLVTIKYTGLNRTFVYVGQRTYGRRGWECYTTSSKTVRPILESVLAGTGGGIRIELEIIGYANTQYDLDCLEDKNIKEYYSRYTSRRCYNKALHDGTLLDAVARARQAKFAKKKPARKPYGGSSTWSVG